MLDAKCVIELNVMEAFPKQDLGMSVVQGNPVCSTFVEQNPFVFFTASQAHF